ncbi:MAG: YmdB family metallophosphoesterase, partial [Patescibacteria group bacterium]
VWKKEDVVLAAQESGALLATPLNDPRTPDGCGSFKLNIAGSGLLVVNLLGRTFMKETGLTCPFRAMDDFLKSQEDFSGPIILDFHAEATSEKVALGWYLDGRISALLGTHTHIPTADYKILPQGTAYVTDLGMVGPADSVLGVTKELIIEKFLTDGPIIFNYPETGPAEVNAVLLEFDASNKAIKIEKINQLAQS